MTKRRKTQFLPHGQSSRLRESCTVVLCVIHSTPPQLTSPRGTDELRVREACLFFTRTHLYLPPPLPLSCFGGCHAASLLSYASESDACFSPPTLPSVPGRLAPFRAVVCNSPQQSPAWGPWGTGRTALGEGSGKGVPMEG